jgi:hypothetical protein
LRSKLIARVDAFGRLCSECRHWAVTQRDAKIREPPAGKETTVQTARLIPISGIGSVGEAEQRASSALLAVLTIVRDLSIDLLAPLGASKAQKATVEAFTEVAYDFKGKKIRPDGLVRVSYGKSSWSTFAEVKTRGNTLSADQINEYWDLARSGEADHVLTISNEIAPIRGMHPAEPDLRVRKNSPIQVTHLSWTAILTTAIRIKQHRGVDDPEQAWILGELIRYLEHPASGALAFDDMGPHWVEVRDGVRNLTVQKRDEGVQDVAARWDQLIRFAGLKLGSEIGEDVAQHLPRNQRDPTARLDHLTDELCEQGTLSGALHIRNTAGDLELFADLRGQQVSAAIEVGAPQDKGARGRVSWLANQLKGAPGTFIIEAYPKNVRAPNTATLDAVREDRGAVLGEDGREPHKFRVVARGKMGGSRKSGKKTPGFIDSVLGLVDRFYADVVQEIEPWRPPAPRIKRPEPYPDEMNEDSTPQISELSVSTDVEATERRMSLGDEQT